jgi:hypothetical protein
LWLILLKVDIYATKICIKVELFSIKSSIYLIFKEKYFVSWCLIAYFLIDEYCDLRCCSRNTFYFLSRMTALFNGGYMKRILVAALCIFPIIGFATDSSESCAKVEDESERLRCYDSVFKADEQSVKTDIQNWQYIEKMDEMRNKMTYVAYKFSSNSVDLPAPYEKDTQASIAIRRHSQFGDGVLFNLHGGHFKCNRVCNIAIKFDSDKVENYSFLKLPDNPGVLFLFEKDDNKFNNFVLKLKESKKLIVELPIYSVGKKQFTFNTEGLKWKYF